VLNRLVAETLSVMRYEKFQTSVRTVIVLIASCGAVVWAWRHVSESSHTPTTRDWVRSLDTGTFEDRTNALHHLEKVDSAEVDNVTSALERALRGAEVPVRIEAAVALARYATFSAPGSQAIDESRIARAATSLLEALSQNQDSDVCASVASSLASIYQNVAKSGTKSDSDKSGPLNAETLVAAFDAVLKRDPATRLAVIDGLERLGRLPLPAPPGLLNALDDPSYVVRGKAVVAISHFTTGADKAIPILLDDLQTNPSRFPPDYVAAAQDMNPSPSIAPILINALASDNGAVREASAVLLGRIAPLPRSAVPALITSLKKQISTGAGIRSDGDSESAKFTKAGGFGPRSGTRRPEPEPGWVSADLTKALARTATPEEALPLLIEILEGKSPSARQAAAEGLAELGPAGHAAIPLLVAALKQALAAKGRSASEYGAATARALGNIAPGSVVPVEEAVLVLREALDANRASIRSAAAGALGRFGPKASGAAPRLRELLEDRDRVVKTAAESALTKIESKSEPTNELQR
jgi:HEAT repeat protein